jgi:hypothetical protein
VEPPPVANVQTPLVTEEGVLEQLALFLVVSGVLLSASGARLTIQAMMGQGPRKLCPLPVNYWTGLALIIVAGRLQIGL